MTKNAIIYKRVSTDEQAEKGYSLPHQSNECRRYASLNDLTVIQEFSDDYSGATLERPGFSQLRAYISQYNVDAIIVYTADRLSRNIIDFLVLRDQWEKAGIELHFVDRGKSKNNFEGLLTDGIFALLAHGERLKIIERTTNGRHAKAKDNHIVMTGIPPYGYNRIGIGRDAEYVIDPFQSEVVKNIFDWYVNGYENKGTLTLRGISNLLDQMGVTPPNYRVNHIAPYWHPNSISVILENSIYTGITYYGKLKTVNGKRFPRPKEEWTLIKVPHLALISTEIFEQAERRKNRNKEIAKRNRKGEYLMSGYFRCATCGTVMFGYRKPKPSLKAEKSFYRCSAKTHKGSHCNGLKKQVSMRKVDTAVWGWVASLLEDENNLDDGIRAMIEKRASEVVPKQERLNTIESLLLGADTRIQRLVDELSQYDGNAVRDVIREKIREIESERNMIAEEGDRLLKELEQIDLSPNFEHQIKRTAEVIREKLSGTTIQDRRMVLEALGLRAEYYYDVERGDVLFVSCAIPFSDSQIALSTSPKSSPRACNSSIRRKRKSR